jgi:Uma2 family endonuclease
LTPDDDDGTVVVMSGFENVFEAALERQQDGRTVPARRRKPPPKESSITTQEGRMTIAEYFATPETLIPQELIFGVMRVADAPFVNHQRLVLRLATALQAHAEQAYAGEVFVAPIDVVLDHERALVLQPDLLFVSAARRDIVRERIYGAPDLVIEVLSPRPRIGDLDERVNWFAQYGVREIWLYDQHDARLHILGCEDGAVQSRVTCEADSLITSDVLPDFQRTVRSVLDRG